MIQKTVEKSVRPDKHAASLDQRPTGENKPNDWDNSQGDTLAPAELTGR